MASISLATISALAGTYPAKAADFSKRSAKLAESVKAYVDANIADAVLTTQGDIITGDASGDAQRLAVGSANTILKSDGTDPSWGSVVNANVDAAAAIVVSKLAFSTANYVVKTNSAGDAVEQGLLVNANLDAAAGVASRKKG